MSQYNIFEAIYLSFFSKKLYRDVASFWGGKAFLYAFLILALSWVASVFHLQHAFSTNYASFSQALVDQVPIIDIKAGKIVTPENKPYVVTDPNSKETLLVIDTSGQYTSLTQANTDLLILQDKIINKSGDTTKVTQLPVSLTYTLVPVVVNEHLKGWVAYLWVFLLPIATFFSFLGMVLKSLIYGLIGRIFSAFTQSGLSFYQCMCLYFVAATPALTLWTILSRYDIYYPHQALSLFTLVLIYLGYAILANKPAKGA